MSRPWALGGFGRKIGKECLHEIPVAFVHEKESNGVANSVINSVTNSEANGVTNSC